MRLLFIMDPFEGLLWDKDTTFALIRGAARRGHEVHHCLVREVSNRGRDLYARARELRVRDEPPYLTSGVPSLSEVSSFDAVLVRKDPPFDDNYLFLTQQLELIRGKMPVINDPRGLREANEKLFTFHFVEHMPRSMVSASPADILGFVEEVGGKAVLKPLDGAGGAGVVVLTSGDPNNRSLCDVWTRDGKRLALVQEYQPQIREGDKRVLLLDGKLLGSILRVPRPDDVRANIHAGGKVLPTELTPAEKALVEAVGPELSRYGLYLVGLDLIGEKLIEVNVTSPTGIQELGRFLGRPVEQDVIEWIEGRVERR